MATRLGDEKAGSGAALKIAVPLRELERRRQKQRSGDGACGECVCKLISDNDDPARERSAPLTPSYARSNPSSVGVNVDEK